MPPARGVPHLWFGRPAAAGRGRDAGRDGCGPPANGPRRRPLPSPLCNLRRVVDLPAIGWPQPRRSCMISGQFPQTPPKIKNSLTQPASLVHTFALKLDNCPAFVARLRLTMVGDGATGLHAGSMDGKLVRSAGPSLQSPSIRFPEPDRDRCNPAVIVPRMDRKPGSRN